MKLVVAITGASGVELSLPLLEVLKEKGVKIFLVVSDAAKIVFEKELGTKWEKVEETLKNNSEKIFSEKEIYAPIASGSVYFDGMIILPCSMKTLAAIALGLEINLIARAASVCLKEKRKLVLCVREAPLRVAHLKNMLSLAEEGAVILPLVMSFYGKERNKYEFMINNIIGKILSVFGLEFEKPWKWEES